jgi:hypothetical protein
MQLKQSHLAPMNTGSWQDTFQTELSVTRGQLLQNRKEWMSNGEKTNNYKELI